MKSSEIRQRFIKFFESHGHVYADSSSLIPENDPSLLFANAGMNQFKAYFTGQEKAPQKRVVTIQKCLRAGGKHNDLENVGFTARHHTFFEMMGNFSFGDYFKKEAIAFAWQFLTEDLKIPQEKLLVTVHKSDREAYDIWHKEIGLSKEKIFYKGDQDNFWEMGELGPCGPCSEIFYDHGEEHKCLTLKEGAQVIDDEDRYIEIWNLVFMQFEKFKEKGVVQKRPLPKPCVDTGMGLERLAAALQGKYNNYETDAFQKIISRIEELSGLLATDSVENLTSMRVVADHLRSSVMLLTEGALPSSEGRGYVLRRIIRRAVRHLEKLGVQEPLLFELAPVVFESYEGAYKNNQENLELAVKYLEREEINFRKTLDSGLSLLSSEIKKHVEQSLTVFSGKSAFLLYDTHGFPVDLTESILKEKGFELNKKEFQEELEQQKTRSRKSSQFQANDESSFAYHTLLEKLPQTVFCGDDSLEAEAKLLWMRHEKGAKHVELIFDQSPCYAQSGGQDSDAALVFVGNRELGHIDFVKKESGAFFVHCSENLDIWELGKKYLLKVNKKKRKLTSCHHSATHLLHYALRKKLGTHVKQAGSFVGADRLRFDFSHPEALSEEDLQSVETLVNQKIFENHSVEVSEESKETALEMGAMALFGEKYGDKVRVVKISEDSIELCGGTHVKNTSEISAFLIRVETSVASGIRRIEAIASEAAVELNQQRNADFRKASLLLNKKVQNVSEEIIQLQSAVKTKEKELKTFKKNAQHSEISNSFDDVEILKKDFYYLNLKASTDADLRSLSDQFFKKFKEGVFFAYQENAELVKVLIRTHKKSEAIHCGDFLKEALSNLGGRGGGKAEIAQGSLPTKSLNDFSTLLRLKLKSS